MAADESSVENVNIKNRPMNIADEYIHFCSNEWLAAKTVLDEVELDDLQEVEKVQLLFQILMVIFVNSHVNFLHHNSNEYLLICMMNILPNIILAFT